MLKNDVCDPECNRPDCFDEETGNLDTDLGSMAYDDGYCCPGKGTATDTHPLMCLDPAESSKDYDQNTGIVKSWRFDTSVPQCRKQAMNQGSCGSCYAFGAAAVQVHQACWSGDPSSDLAAITATSSMYMDSCVATKYGHGSCQGGVVQYMMREYSETGVPAEECYPYAYGGDPESHFGGTSETIQSCDDVKAVKENICPGSSAEDFWMKTDPARNLGSNPWSSHYMNPQNAQSLKEKLLQQGPLGFTYTTYSSFMNYDFSQGPKYPYTTTGSYYPGSYQGGHAVALVGWMTLEFESTTKEVWVLQNSWDRTWGDDGYFYLDMADDWSANMGATVIGYKDNGMAWEKLNDAPVRRKLQSMEAKDVEWQPRARPVNKLRRALLQSSSGFNKDAKDGTFPVRDVIAYDEDVMDFTIVGSARGANCSSDEMAKKLDKLKEFIEEHMSNSLPTNYNWGTTFDCSNQVISPNMTSVTNVSIQSVLNDLVNLVSAHFAVAVENTDDNTVEVYQLNGMPTMEVIYHTETEGCDENILSTCEEVVYNYTQAEIQVLTSSNPNTDSASPGSTPAPTVEDGAVARFSGLAFLTVLGMAIIVG